MKKATLLTLLILPLSLIACAPESTSSESSVSGSEQNQSATVSSTSSVPSTSSSTPADSSSTSVYDNEPEDSVDISHRDPHLEKTPLDFNIYFLPEADYYLRNWVWIWGDNLPEGINGYGFQTGADLTYVDGGGENLFIPVYLSFSRSYVAYTDWYYSKPADPLMKLDSPGYFNKIIFRNHAGTSQTKDIAFDPSAMDSFGKNKNSVYISEKLLNENYDAQGNPNNANVQYAFYAPQDLLNALKEN